ncbi:serine hydrolase domain-containing protein [Aquiflexum sp.]|uniref:serine hydrolase domain-containing protein n=1 Tax=Aquiflexum sp. TaxID=1872584 RepID=UPI00359474D0
MKQLILSLLISLISLTSFTQKQKTDNRFSGLDTELEKVLQTWKAAGFAVAVVEKDKIIYSKGFGYRDYENKIPVTPNTLFAIGSSSKAFTSGLLGILREEDKFALKIVEGFVIEFLEDKDGNIKEAKFIQPNGVFVAKKK